MNKKQKIVLVVGAVLIFSALILWLAHGGEIFTKTQVLIEKQDDLGQFVIFGPGTWVAKNIFSNRRKGWKRMISKNCWLV